MKTFTIKRNSLLYHFLWTYSPWGMSGAVHEDFCSTMKYFLWSTFVVVFLVFLVAFLSWVIIVCPAIYFITMFPVTHQWITIETMFLFVLLVVVAGKMLMEGMIVCAGMYIRRQLDRRTGYNSLALPPKQPSFFVQAYRSLKDKYCIEILVR